MSVMEELETGSFATPQWLLCAPASIKIVNWNIDRGLKLRGVIEFLAAAKADIILLQETDQNARRTHQLNIPREIAQKLQMNYVFGREFQELTQGTHKSPAYHGQTTLSRWRLSNSRMIRFQRQSNFWRPRWYLPDIDPFQERIGGRLALVSSAEIAGRTVVTYNLHLESKGDDALRFAQIEETVKDTRQYDGATPVLLTGDFNLDASSGNAAVLISSGQFQNAFSTQRVPTTPNTLFENGRPIDWIFSRGPIRTSQAQVHRSVSASDHYPVSVTVSFA